MTRTVTWILAILFGIVLAGALLCGGFFLGRASWGMLGWLPFNRAGWLNMGPGMMGYYGQGEAGTIPYGSPAGPGMMGGYGMIGPGMMGGYTQGGLSQNEPLTLEQAAQALDDYLKGLDNPDLAVGEIMIFDNHAYAEIVEKSTGIGAMEVLVDPATKAVYPEHGPNMMWNLKYSPMGQYGMGRMGPGMMGGNFRQPQDLSQVSPEMPVTPEQAVAAAQGYLDETLPGTQVDEHADPFYGYYTLHVMRDGNVIGMLSVNGFNASVFPHTWHGQFIEMSEEEE